MEIDYTRNEKLQKIMSYEFFKEKNGQKVFDPEEVKCYLERMSSKQKKILSCIGDNELTGFVVFGDGNITRNIEGKYLWDSSQSFSKYTAEELQKKYRICAALKKSSHEYLKINTREANGKNLYLDVDIKPNASFSLFRKTGKNKAELLTYTRYFVLSYEDKYNCTVLARKLITLMDQSGQDEHKLGYLFTALSNTYMIRQSCSINGWKKPPKPRKPVNPNRRKMQLYLRDLKWWRGLNPKQPEFVANRPKYYFSNTDISEDTPYIGISYKTRARRKSNVWWMGGAKNYNRQGEFYEYNTIHGGIPTRGCWMIYRNTRYDTAEENPAYKEYLEHFAGIKNGQFGKNIFNKQFGPGKPWAGIFFFRRTDRFTEENGDTTPFRLR